MARVKLDPEGARQRNLEAQKRYRESHPEEMKVRKREEARTTIAKLVEAGVYVPLTAGRKRMYTPEEAIVVAKRQRQESYLRRRERIAAAKAQLAQTEDAE